MCFSNLPVEFDEHGNPGLAASADEDEDDHAHVSDAVERATDGDDLDPETRYREILDDLPDRARERLGADDREARHQSIAE